MKRWLIRVSVAANVVLLVAVVTAWMLLASGKPRYVQALENWENQKTQIEAKLRSHINASAKGENLREFIKEAKHARYERSQAIFTDEVRAEKEKGIEKPLRDRLRDEYWSAPVPDDPKTGDLDFKARDKVRTEVLAKASRMGVDPEYILDRGVQWKDPEVRRIMAEYDTDMETLRPYWDIRDKPLQEYPQFAGLVNQEKELVAAGKTTTNSQLMKDIHDSTRWKMWEEAMFYRQGAMRRNPKTGVTAAGMKWGYLGPWTDALEKAWQKIR